MVRASSDADLLQHGLERLLAPGRPDALPAAEKLAADLGFWEQVYESGYGQYNLKVLLKHAALLEQHSPLLNDVLRWLLQFGSGIAAQPQHTARRAAEAAKNTVVYKLGAARCRGKFAVLGGPLEWGPLKVVMDGHKQAVDSLVVFPNGEWAASSSADGQIVLWNIASGAQVRKVAVPNARITGLAVSPDGRWIASGDSQATVRIWDVDTGAQVRW